MADDPSLASGVNVTGGQVVCRPVAEAHAMAYTPLDALLYQGPAAPPAAPARRGLRRAMKDVVSHAYPRVT